MSYCRKCGAYIPDDYDACPACGAGAHEDTASAAQAAAAKWAEEQKKKDGGEYHRKFTSDDRTEEKQTGSPGYYYYEYDRDAKENSGLGILCYLGVLFVIPFFTRPDSQFLRYHCNQGLVLTLFCTLSSLCYNIPVIGWLAGTAGWILGIYCFFKGISNVTHGRRSPLPVIGQITIIK